MHRSGFVALIGRPNVGKSTLLNALLGEKVAIVSDKPQTTRNRIRAVLTLEQAQVIFIDTPGLHKPKHKLGEAMVRAARATLQEVDLVCFLVEANREPGPGDRYIAELLKGSTVPVFLIMNKIDLAKPALPARRADLYRALHSFSGVFALSALKKQHLAELVEAVVGLLPEGPQYYPPDMVTDQPERFIAAEIIREKIIHLTREEIPFSVAVVVEEMALRKGNGLIDIYAAIFVERQSQVGIVVGKDGLLLKKAGTEARRELEALLGLRVFLDLRVKVKPNWRNRDANLHDFGYDRL
jgi:GTP-binding protein Era